MTCPSCNLRLDTLPLYCIRCGFPLARFGRVIALFRATFTWVLRRSLAGLVTGWVGWFVVAAAGRASGAALSQMGHLLLTGCVGGFFLGIVEGMVEDSSLKAFRSGLAGIGGGLLGGILGHLLLRHSEAGMSAVVVAWAVTGVTIGLVSVWQERQPVRLAIGAIAGGFGGALGGWLGYQMYASLLDMTKPEFWWLQRVIEGITGAVLGALLWFILGLAEKLWIFKRRLASNISYKECDRCRHSNVLKAWYCAACGALLQVAAPPEKLHLPKRQALARLISASQFLGQLSAMSGVAVSLLVAFFLGAVNFFLGVFGLLAVALVGYLLYILFNAIADLLSPLLDGPPPAASSHRPPA
jgi:hypothetical protein